MVPFHSSSKKMPSGNWVFPVSPSPLLTVDSCAPQNWENETNIGFVYREALVGKIRCVGFNCITYLFECEANRFGQFYALEISSNMSFVLCVNSLLLRVWILKVWLFAVPLLCRTKSASILKVSRESVLLIGFGAGAGESYISLFFPVSSIFSSS